MLRLFWKLLYFQYRKIISLRRGLIAILKTSYQGCRERRKIFLKSYKCIDPTFKEIINKKYDLTTGIWLNWVSLLVTNANGKAKLFVIFFCFILLKVYEEALKCFQQKLNFIKIFFSLIFCSRWRRELVQRRNWDTPSSETFYLQNNL